MRLEGFIELYEQKIADRQWMKDLGWKDRQIKKEAAISSLQQIFNGLNGETDVEKIAEVERRLAIIRGINS